MGQIKVLIVEDEDHLRTLICDKLKQLGYDVDQASDGKQGLLKIAENPPDVIVSDVLMPNMDGNKMIKELKSSTQGRNIPVIILTARVMMRDYFELMPVSSFLEKPFRIDDLVKSIETALANRGQAIKSKKSNPLHPNQGGSAVSAQGEEVIKDALFELPWIDKEETSRAAAPGAGRQEAPRNLAIIFKGKVIAILEKNRNVWAEIGRVLMGLGFEAIFFDDVTEFGKAVTIKTPDMMMICQLTQQYDALVLAKNLKRHASLRRVPVIIYGRMGDQAVGFNEHGLSSSRFVLNDEGRQVIKKIIESFTAL